MMKNCARCKNSKPLAEFYRNPNSGRLASYCGPCAKDYEQEHRAKNPEMARKRAAAYRKRHPRKTRNSHYAWCEKNPEKWAAINQRHRNKTRALRAVWEAERRAKIRQEVFMAYGGFICVCCGEDEPLFMTIDHIDNNGANHRRALKTRIGKGGASFFDWLRREKFPPGFQVLCRNCNWGKHANGGVCPHHNPEGSETIPAGSRARAARKAESPSLQRAMI